MTLVKVFVPATIGNVGPGFDALGLAVDGLGDVISLELIDGPSEIGEVTGLDAELIPRDASKNATVIAAEALLAKHHSKKGVRVSFDRRLPVSGGLGASAAASVAGAFAAALALQINTDHNSVMKAALSGEAYVAGRHLDNIAPCACGGLTLVLSVDPIRVFNLPLKDHWWITLITPNVKLDTKVSRKVLPESLKQNEWVDVMAHAIGVSHGFSHESTDLIKSSLNDSYAEPRRSPLVPGFDSIKKAALDHGALGCSLSGAGPTIFAISDNRETANKCLEAMSKVAPDATVKHVGRVSHKGARAL